MEGDRTISNDSVALSIGDGAQRMRALHGRTSGPTRRSTKGQWTAEEDEILHKAVQHFKGKNWKKIAECFKDRTDVQCLHRWQKVLNPELVKGPWSKEEDEQIIELVNKFGPKKWSTIAQHLPGRIGKQCRERWHNHLNPSINKEAWTQEEELALIRAHQIFGNRWAELTKFLPGRTDNAIKNHWNSSVKKKLDSYIASGLLEQFQFPLIANQSQPMPSSSSRVQSNLDDSGAKCRTEAEDISECSQESTMIGCSQSASDLANAGVHTREKLDSYIASGLLEQFQFPLIANQGQPTHSSSSRMQSNLDDSGAKCRTEAEDISECSQESTMIGCSQSASDLANAGVHTREKLDSYIASGLLEQFQFPLIANQGQPTHSSSSRMQSNLDDSGAKCRTEAEDISECSQESTMIGCSQSASDLANAAVHTREKFHLTEMPDAAKEKNSSPAPCTEEYYPSLEDVNFSIPEIPCEAGYSSSGDYQFGLPDLPNISSLELGQESSGLPTHCINTSKSCEVMNVAFQTSVGLNAPTSFINMVSTSEKPEHMLITDDECCRVLFSEAMNDGCFASENFTQGSNMVELGGCTNTSLCQASDIQISETGRTPASQSNCPSKSEVLPTSCCQSFVSPSLLSVEDGTLMYGREFSQLNGQPLGTQEQEFTMNAHDVFIYTNDDHTDKDNTDLQVQSYLTKDSLKLVPVNSFGSESNALQTCHTVNDKPNLPAEQDVGGLCYEPPRFPSLDIPFFSCDLIPSGSDMQQEYSPLGIRQLMMPSMNCITPFRLWDSPSRDDSPDVVLKSAAKTFTGTPSILKKRHRDLLSPLSERRSDKKLETDMTSSLTKDFSRLDVMFDESGTDNISQVSASEHRTNSGASVEEKENLCQACDGEQDNGGDHTEPLDDEVQKKVSNGTSSQGNIKKEACNIDTKDKTGADASDKIVQRPSVVLVEHNINDILLFSPDQVGLKADRPLLASSMRTPRNQYNKSFGAISNQGFDSECLSGNACIVVSSPTLKIKNSEGHSIAVTAVQCTNSSATLENLIDNAGIDAAIENYNIFGETPFKRSIESPSAWKSPWYINSFVPGPRVDTEITIEDIGYLMSPADKSYDAIGLMKQLSGHTSAAYADALEVLGNETPESIVKGRRSSNNPNVDKENNQLEAHSDLAERRILDFSECETPGKGTENGKSSTAVSFSSPTSYLLKGCR